jgi:hypothetical protein
MKLSARLPAITLVAFTLFLLRCGKEYNPYENYSNAQIHVVSSPSMLTDGDTVSIFTTETLGVFAAVSEKIGSFSIHADSNCYWTDTSISAPKSEVNYRFLVSFADTGTKNVTITARRTNGDLSTQTLTLRAISPLFQKEISAAVGEPCTLSTPAVGDKVYYFWSFGVYRGVEKVVKTPFSNNPGQNILGVEMGKTLTGQLWVADTLNRFKSPAIPFSYRFSDVSGPQIVCTNKGVRGDTIVTGENNLEFAIHVMDASGDRIDSVELVGGQFDWRSADGLDYKKYFTGVNAFTAQNPGTVIIKAWDMQGNVTTDSLYMYYDPSGPKAELVRFTLYSPPGRSVSTQLDHILVALGVENKTRDTVALRATINGTPFPPEYTFADTAKMVSWNMPLSEGATTLKITASAGSSTYAETTLTVTRDPSAPDTGKPLIVMIAADGNTISPAYPLFTTRKRSADLAIAVFDAGSGVVSVTANGSTLAAFDSTKYLWTKTGFPLVHPYMGIELKVADAAGNLVADTILAISNAPPAIAEPSALPRAFVVHASYADTVVVRDDDNDTASLSIKNGPPGMGLTSIGFNRWRLFYTPADTGGYHVEIQLKDPYSKETVLPWDFKVIRDPKLLVTFVTTADSFPRYLEADRDTLRVNLIARAGYPPYSFTALLGGVALPLNEKTNTASAKIPQLVWAPQASDTGYRQLFISVKDAAGIADTMRPFPTILIVPKNMHPCSLSVVPNPYLTSKGVLDLSFAVRPDTLFFLIADGDNPLTEYYTVNVTQGNVTTAPTIPLLKAFAVIVNPTLAKAPDTLRVTVTDRTNTRDTVILPVIYYVPAPTAMPGVLMWNSGERGAVVTGSEQRVLKWKPFAPQAPVVLDSNVYLDGVPTYVSGSAAGSFPSQPYVHFSAARRSHLINYNNGTWPSHAFTAFFVVRLDTVIKDSCQVLLSSSESYGANAALGVTHNGTFGMLYDGDSTTSFGSSCKVDAHKWYIVCFMSPGAVEDNSGARFSVWANAVADSNIVIDGMSAGPYLMVGAAGKHGATNGLNGDIAEIMMYSRILSVEERVLAVSYLASKYKYQLTTTAAP